MSVKAWPAAGFDAAVALFNCGEYHDVVEELWYGAEDPARTLLHGLLQCAVGFHHLFNDTRSPLIRSGTDYLCLTMDGSPSSCQLLGNFAAGQQLYRLEPDDDTDDGASSIIFSVSDDRTSQAAPPRAESNFQHYMPRSKI